MKLITICFLINLVSGYELCPVSFHSVRTDPVPYEIFPYRLDIKPTDTTFTTVAMDYKRFAMAYSNGYIEVYDWVNGDYVLKTRVYTKHNWQQIQFKTRSWIEGSTNDGKLVDFYTVEEAERLSRMNPSSVEFHYEDPTMFWHSEFTESPTQNIIAGKEVEDKGNEWNYCDTQLAFTTVAFGKDRIAASTYGIHRVMIYMHSELCKWTEESMITNSDVDFGLRIALSDHLLAVQTMRPPVGVVQLYHLPYDPETSYFADIDRDVTTSSQIEILGTSLSIQDGKILVGTKSSYLSHGAMIYCDTDAGPIDKEHCETYTYPHDDFTGYGEVVALNKQYRAPDWSELLTKTSYAFHKLNSNSRVVIYDNKAYQRESLDYVIPPMFDEDIPTNNVQSAFELGVYRFQSKICKCLHLYVNRDFDDGPEEPLFSMNTFLIVVVLGGVLGGAMYYRSIVITRSNNAHMYTNTMLA